MQARLAARAVALSSALLCASVVSLPAHAEPTKTQAAPQVMDLSRGVAVVAADNTSVEDAWKLATAVYREPLLRPRKLNERSARVLAGEPPPKGASPALREWAALRPALGASGPSARRVLSWMARDLDVSALLVVRSEGPRRPRARLFLAEKRGFADPELWPQEGRGGQTSWASSVSWLRSHARASRQPESSEKSGSVLTSGWFWGAVAAAAGAAIVGFAVSRDTEPDTIHLQGRVAP